jgi:hypothetical protein
VARNARRVDENIMTSRLISAYYRPYLERLRVQTALGAVRNAG